MPTKVHHTFERAKAERDRLAANCPGQRFFVMSPVLSAGAEAAAYAWSEGKSDGLEQAHREIMHAEAKTDRLLDERMSLRNQLRAVGPLLERALAFQGIVADALLWFDGFKAAHAHREGWDQPRVPDRATLADLNGAYQRLLAAKRGEDADMEIPF